MNKLHPNIESKTHQLIRYGMGLGVDEASRDARSHQPLKGFVLLQHLAPFF